MSKLAAAQAMIAHYNAHDTDAYVALMTDNAVEAGYRGDVLREGREGVRAGLNAMFAQFPENRAQIIAGYELGEFAVLHEKVWRTAAGAPFDVISVYSFEGDLCSRVEFIR